MKKSRLFLQVLIIAILILTIASFTAEKIFILKFTESELNKHFQKLSAVKQIVDNSNMSHQDALFITRTIDSLQLEMISQVKSQLDNAPKK